MRGESLPTVKNGKKGKYPTEGKKQKQEGKLLTIMARPKVKASRLPLKMARLKVKASRLPLKTARL